MAYKRIERKLAPNGLTSKELAKILELPSIPGERDMEKPRLKKITGLLQTGEFNKVDWASCHCKEDRKTYRVNGQHTSYLLNKIQEGELEADFPEGVSLQWEHWECDKLIELASVFDQFDCPWSVRKPRDKQGVFQAQHEDVRTVNKKLVGSILTGIQWGYSHSDIIAEAIPAEYRGETAYDRGRMLNVQEVRDFILFVADRQDAPFKEWLQRGPLVAWFFETSLRKPLDDFRVIYEMYTYMAGDIPTDFAKWVKQQVSRTGTDAGTYFRELSKMTSKLEKYLRRLSREEIDKMIEHAKNPGLDEEAA